MYSIYANINGMQEMQQASLEGCSLIRYRDEDSIRVRDKLDGEITFWGNSSAQLRGVTVSQTECEIQKDGIVIYTGMLQMRGTWFEESNKCMLGVEIQDEYSLN